MVSLLYLHTEDSPTIDCLENLSLNRIVEEICYTGERSEYVLSILKRPLQDIDNIVYRQEICRDFIAHPKLFDEMTEICRAYNQLKEEWDKASRQVRTQIGASHAYTHSLDLVRDTISTLETNAAYCYKITGFPQSLLQILESYPIQSQGLRSIQTFCMERMQDPNYLRFREIAAELSEVAPMIDKGCELSVDFNDSLYAVAEHLVKVKTQNQEQKQSLFAALFNRAKHNSGATQTSGVTVTLSGASTNEVVVMINEALKEVSALIVQITKGIYPTFANLSQELWFYRFVIKLHSIYEREKVPVCYPQMLPAAEDVFYCEDLYDLLLLVKDYGLKQPLFDVVPNDVKLASQNVGMLVQGDNNSGKTTFLRSIGIAQVFAQAGLPIAAKTAAMSIRSNILAQFSGEDTVAGNDSAGRFESEVREVAQIIDQLQPYSLVLFNETFQTTAFAEAATAIFDILDVISQVKIKWIFVTHLMQLYEMFSRTDDKVIFMQTSKDSKMRYKLVPMDF